MDGCMYPQIGEWQWFYYAAFSIQLNAYQELHAHTHAHKYVTFSADTTATQTLINSETERIEHTSGMLQCVNSVVDCVARMEFNETEHSKRMCFCAFPHSFLALLMFASSLWIGNTVLGAVYSDFLALKLGKHFLDLAVSVRLRSFSYLWLFLLTDPARLMFFCAGLHFVVQRCCVPNDWQQLVITVIINDTASPGCSCVKHCIPWSP